MSSKRNPRTRKGFFGRLAALGKGRFRQAVTGRIYVDSHDMDDFWEEGFDEWERRKEEFYRFQKRMQAEGRLPPNSIRVRASDQEIETMWRLAEEATGRRKGEIIIP